MCVKRKTGECYVGGGEVSRIWDLFLQIAMPADNVQLVLAHMKLYSF